MGRFCLGPADASARRDFEDIKANGLRPRWPDGGITPAPMTGSGHRKSSYKHILSAMHPQAGAAPGPRLGSQVNGADLGDFALTAGRDSLVAVDSAGRAVMHDLTIMFADEDAPRASLTLLLQHFSELSDDREPGRIMYPLAEVLLVVTCATIASCDDFDDIVAWGENNLDFLRRFSEFHFGIPCERWLRCLVNRIDPVLFGRCFHGWIAELWPGL